VHTETIFAVQQNNDKDNTVTELAQIVRADVLSIGGVAHFAPNRRGATLFSEGIQAESIYFLESGLVKTYKLGAEAREVTLEIILPGELFGLQALGAEKRHEVSAEILLEGRVHVIPRDVFLQYCDGRPDMWRLITETLLTAKVQLEKKIELLCLRDVEHRVLHFVAQLAETISPGSVGPEVSIPLSQGEIGSLIGATRETTSATLNTLARRGLLRLGRRQLTVLSLEGLRLASG
jgi:CRP/FNR family cyclic AMP-dependent transcriptional regulator